MKHLAVLFLGLLFAFSASADEITTWTINARGAVFGNDSCGGTCTEAINVSLVETFGVTQNGAPQNFFSGTITGWGVLGPFSDTYYLATVQPADGGYIPTGPPSGDEIDIYFGFDTGSFHAPIPAGPSLYSCYDQVCKNDFAFNTFLMNNPGPITGLFSGGEFSYVDLTKRTVAAPEPNAALLVLAGALLLLICRFLYSGLQLLLACN
jgi:hypothetical protein